MSTCQIHLVHPGAYLQCSSYLLCGAAGAILVDPGSGVAQDEILSRLRALGVPGERLSALLLTHEHVDHALGAGRLQAALGVPLYSSALVAERLAARHPSIWGEHPELIPAIQVDHLLQSNTPVTLSGIELLPWATPGHTPGSMSLLVNTADGQVVLSGDLLMANAQPGWAGPDFSADDTLRSLRSLRAAAPIAVGTGHSWIAGDVDAWLGRGIAAGEAGAWQLESRLTCHEVPAALRTT